METLEFRLPQFSEDLAWVPSWVQHQVQKFDQCKYESPSSSKLKSKISTLIQGNVFAGNEASDNSRCLFLSGEDNSASSFTSSSSQNVLCLNLHLSSNGFSEFTPSQLRVSDLSKTINEPNKFETRVSAKENTSSKMSLGTKQRSHRPVNSKNSMRHRKDADINDAVELSISASEALVIHEIVIGRADSEALLAADALEVSLRMKKARLEWSEDDFGFSTGDVDETDSLSELDDFAMTDAFEDVGLICGSHDQCVSVSSISRVIETPRSENNYEYEDHYICAQRKSDSILNSDATLRKELPLESLSCERQRKLSDDPVSRENYNSTHQGPSAMDMGQIVGSAAEYLNPSQPQLKEPIIGCESSLKSTGGEDMMAYPISERFKSRWLGGWTAKEEVNALEQVKLNNPKSILNPFTCETSFLSESADVAPDENSIVQICEIDPHGASQSSIAVEVLLDKASKEIFFSQDAVRSPSLSLLDPLCSVVPCSISVEDMNSVDARNHENAETDLERDFRPIIECEIENPCKISNVEIEIQCTDEKIMQIINKGSEGTIRKHMTSLKTYSTLFPSNAATSDEGILHCNRSFQWQYGFGVSDELRSNHLPLLTSPSKCFLRSEKEELCETVLNRNLVKGLKNKNASSRGDRGVATLLPKERGKESGYKNSHLKNFRARKRVRFSEVEGKTKPNKNILGPNSGKMCSTKTSKKLKPVEKPPRYRTCQEDFRNRCTNVGKGGLLQGMQFLLTGISSQKEKEIKVQIQTQGGMVLPDIPSPSILMRSWSRSNCYQLPFILSTRKLRTAKFLYGCAVDTFILHVDWLTDSIGAGSILPPEKYLILPWQIAQSSDVMKQVHHDKANSIFENVGIMLHGKHSFCTKLEKIVKHGGGQVFKSLQRLVECLEKEKISIGAIITDDDSMSSRHLRQCASEWKLPIMPSSWIIKSLYSGKLLPFTE